ncbi:hypothetical protein BD414DRAFT_491649 [Trametes punicea]|nr:hypothetical protein BD414DRAFT_491649 [Trametes punicea]
MLLPIAASWRSERHLGRLWRAMRPIARLPTTRWPGLSDAVQSVRRRGGLDGRAPRSRPCTFAVQPPGTVQTPPTAISLRPQTPVSSVPPWAWPSSESESESVGPANARTRSSLHPYRCPITPDSGPVIRTASSSARSHSDLVPQLVLREGGDGQRVIQASCHASDHHHAIAIAASSSVAGDSQSGPRVGAPALV